MDIRVIREIGAGVSGTVYLVESGKKKYIYKIEKILDTEAYERQVDFDEKVAKFYPNTFLTLKSHGIINSCKHKQFLPKFVKGAFRKALEKKDKSHICIFLLYEPVLKYTLDSIRDKLYSNQNLYLKMAYDLIFAIDTMHRAGFTHNDIHTKNVMTDGKNFYLIDYGRISHKTYNQSSVEKEIKKYNLFDIDMCLWNCLIYNKPAIHIIENDIPLPSIKKFIKSISQHDEYKKFHRQLNHLRGQRREEMAILVTAMYHPNIYCECLGLKNIVLPVIAPIPKLIHYIIDHMLDKQYDSILRYIKKMR